MKSGRNLGDNDVGLGLDDCVNLSTDGLDLCNWLVVSLSLLYVGHNVARLIRERLGLLISGGDHSLIDACGSISQSHHTTWQSLRFRDRAQTCDGGCHSLVDFSGFGWTVDSLVDVRWNLGDNS